MKKRRCFEEAFEVESLESRTVMAAGAVSVQLVSGTWRITGGANADKIVMSLLPTGAIRVQGAANGGGLTKVNNGSYRDIDGTHPVAINMNGGGDDVEMRGISAAQRLRFASTMSISLGDGIDRLYTSYLTVVGSVSINTGTGNGSGGYETVTLVNSDVGAVTYTTSRPQGWQNFNTTATTIRGNLTVTGSIGAMALSMASTTITGSFSANMGGGQGNLTINKNISMTSVTVGGSISVTGGPSRNTFSFGTVVATSITLTGSGDLDQFGLNNCRFNTTRIDGRSGQSDRVWGRGNTFVQAPVLISIERNELRP